MLKLVIALSKRNKLTYIHPLEKIFMTIVPIIIMGFIYNPMVIFGNIMMFFLMHIIIKNNMKIVANFAFKIAAFAAFSSLTFVFDYGLKYVYVIILKCLFSGLSLSFFTLTTPIEHILYYFSKNKWLTDICDIAKSMERFLMILDDEYNIMHNAMKSRGGFDGFSSKIKSTGKIAALLFVNTMERWKNIKDGLDSRCYKGYTPYIAIDFNFSYKRFIFICIYNFILIFLAIYLK